MTVFFVKKFYGIEEKLDVLSAAMVANFRANPGLDEDRVDKALDGSGFKPRDFMCEAS
jgi:hypothetical protein